MLLLLATGTRLLITGRWNQVYSPSQHAGFVKKLCEQTFWLVSDNLLEVCVYAPHSSRSVPAGSLLLFLCTFVCLFVLTLPPCSHCRMAPITEGVPLTASSHSQKSLSVFSGSDKKTDRIEPTHNCKIIKKNVYHRFWSLNERLSWGKINNWIC